MDKLTRFNDRIEKLKKEKLKFQTQQAVLFRREAEKLFDDSFSPEIALAVLSDWRTATDAKKKEWAAKTHLFRPASLQHIRKKIETPAPEPDEK
ncbi:MAG: hypothetical protein H0X26_10030 [Alphaproteobacteria bacterium]|nr:hypothetical protein [Alphaproteobacteria bacterium]